MRSFWNVSPGRAMPFVMLIAGLLSLVPRPVHAKICGSIDIRNDLRSMSQLQNCTIIQGYLLIILIDYNEHPYSHISLWSFPELREITGYLLLGYVKGVDTFAHLFPNLVVIRGNIRIANKYSLMVWSNDHLEHIAFPSLTTILQGFVVIDRNPELCYARAIDWERITVEDESKTPGFTNEIQNITLSGCPSLKDCKKCNPENCWNPDLCQSYESGYGTNGTIKCHPMCLGGCTNTTIEGCSICRGVTWKGKCIPKCPANTFLHKEWNTCVEDCSKYEKLGLLGQCWNQCPEGYSHMYDLRKDLDFTKCYKCDGFCHKVCKGSLVDKQEYMWRYKSCTTIMGDLYISLDGNNYDSNDLMYSAFQNIREIYGALRIIRSSAFLTLDYFRNLTLIHYEPDPKEKFPKEETKYALEIMHNTNLHELFTFKNASRPSIRIIGGSIRIDSNDKLCPQMIEQSLANIEYNKTNEYIGDKSNGALALCVFSEFNTSVILQSSTVVTIQWDPFEVESNDKLLGFTVFYVKTEVNVTLHTAFDSCAPHMWTSEFVEPRPPTTDPADELFDEPYSFNLTRLYPNNRYAYYVQAMVSEDFETIPVNVTQGQSSIDYFVTPPTLPLPPFVTTLNKTDTTITLDWFHPAWDVDRLVVWYEFDFYEIPDEGDEVAQRDYCRHPKERGVTETHKYIAHSESAFFCCESKGFQHTRFVSGHFGLDGDPDMCGDEDPECQNQINFHILTTSSKYFTHELQAIRDEELELLSLPLPYNPEYAESHLHREALKDRYPDYFVRTEYIEHKPQIHEGTIRDLIPFQRYAFEFHSCNNYTGCGPYFLHFERTLRNLEADSIAITAKKMDDDPEGIIVNVSPPQFPNGVTVSYIIERTMGSNYEQVCMTNYSMTEAKFNIYFRKLVPGTHVIRARSISLGADGPWSISHMVTIYETGSWRFPLVVSAAILLGIAICLITYNEWLKMNNTSIGEQLAAVLNADVPLVTRRAHVSQTPRFWMRFFRRQQPGAMPTDLEMVSVVSEGLPGAESTHDMARLIPQMLMEESDTEMW